MKFGFITCLALLFVFATAAPTAPIEDTPPQCGFEHRLKQPSKIHDCVDNYGSCIGDKHPGAIQSCISTYCRCLSYCL